MVLQDTLTAGDKFIHVVAFDIPYPANYGGVIDVFYKLKALHEAGYRIHLHCFRYGGRSRSIELHRFCEFVSYYRRRTYAVPTSGKLPYIVSSRRSSALLRNLCRDRHPILFEGLHCTYYLNHPQLKDRYRIVRMHNIEYLYYKHLAKVEKNSFKRFYFNAEAERLRQYEDELKSADAVAAISPQDHDYLDRKYGNSFYMPAFHPNEIVDIAPGGGDYALYHGKLSVGENNEAALYLIREVFRKTDYPLVIAGMNPTTELQRAVSQTPNVSLERNVSHDRMHELVAEARLNILPTFQQTGIKLKLINVLYNGRHCIANPKMVEGTGLEDLCHIADDADGMLRAIERLKHKPFDRHDIKRRVEVLEERFSNRSSIAALENKLWQDDLAVVR